MLSRMPLFVLTLLTCLLATPLRAEVDAPANLDELIDILESSTEGMQGGAMAILYKGEVVYKRVFGYRRGTEGPVTEHTLFPLASVSKPVCATAIALAVNNGKLTWNEKYKFPYIKNAISLKEILSHTTGYDFPGNPQIEEGLGRVKMYEALKSEKPKCKPGQCYSYSNALFSLSEEALRQKKLKLENLLTDMTKAIHTDGIKLIPDPNQYEVAYPHVETEDGFEPQPYPPYYPKATPSAAGAFASIDGMIEFFRLSFDERSGLVYDKTRHWMKTGVLTNNDMDKWGIELPFSREDLTSSYGVGWRIIEHRQFPGEPLIYHAGAIKGVNTVIGYIPSVKVGFIILLNQGYGLTTDTALQLWAACLE